MLRRNLITYFTIFLFSILLTAQAVASDKGEQSDKINKLPDLNEFGPLQEIFQQEKGNVRMIALLSASCGYCIKGYRYMRKILDEIPDERLKMVVIWEPMLSGDTKELSYKMSKKVKDPRMIYQAWDENRMTGKIWTNVMLNGDERWYAKGPAWDVYFLYGGDTEWNEDQPNVPDYWQHQGAGSSELVLNYKLLKAKVEEFLAQLDKQAG